MIKLINVKKEYHDREVLNGVNIEISKPGMYIICGESGCGKSTLINIIGLLDDSFEGEYQFFEKNIKKASEKEKALFRFNQIGYIFQTPKFLENESIKKNIEIGVGRKIKKTELIRWFKKLNLKISFKKKVSTLSGGERKRLAIIIALLKDSPLILADEVTVGLDEVNKHHILEFLCEESKNRVIIMVTHDIESIKKYTNNIYFIENKKVELREEGYVLEKEINKNNILSDSFLFKHVISHISSKGGRTFICSFSMIVALVCLGFCLLLTSSLSESITSSLNSSLNSHQIIMSQKEDMYTLNENIVVDLEEMNKIKKEFGHYFYYQGCKYSNDFSSFFKDSNHLYIEINGKKVYLKDYGVDQINNFIYFDETTDNYIYTYNYDLQEDEVIISLTLNQIYTYCKMLNIEYKNEASLLDYLQDNYLPLEFCIENSNWEYQIDINLKMVGYYVDTKPAIYHSNSLWNEYMIEHVLQLPYSNDLDYVDEIPWMTKRINYFSLVKGKEMKFLNRFISNEKMKSYNYGIFEIEDRICVYFTYSHEEYLDKKEIENILKSNGFNTYIACSNNGYNVVNEALIAGFSFPTFITNEYKLLDEYIDYNTYSENNLGSYQSTVLTSTNNKLLSLNILDSNNDNYLKIKTYVDENKNITGSYPKGYNQIIISSGLANKLNIKEKDGVFSEKPIYFMTLKSIDYANGKYKNNFIIEKLFVSGIIEDDEEFIYVTPYWGSIYLTICLQKNSSSYLTNKVIFDYSGDDIENVIESLNKKYPKYIFENPFIDYKKTIDETILYINIGLGIFSSFSFVSAVLMMIISSYLFVVDTKKEIGIYTFYGYRRKSIVKQYKLIGSLLSIYSSILSSLCLALTMIMLNEGMLGIRVPFTLNSLVPFIVINVLSLIIGDIASFISTRQTLKESPLKQLQEN